MIRNGLYPLMKPFYIKLNSMVYVCSLRSLVIARTNPRIRIQYDMLTTPVTTSHFHSRVLALLSASCTSSFPSSLPLISPLTPADTTLVPGERISHLVAVSSNWIDLCSSDPLISGLSRQVLNMEVAYAAFCGFGNIVISGPKLHHNAVHSDGLVQYARAIQEVLNIGIYMSVSILLPFADIPGSETDEVMGSLAPSARKEDVKEREGKPVMKSRVFESWDAWHMIRTMCKYSQRLHVGKRAIRNSIYSV